VGFIGLREGSQPTGDSAAGVEDLLKTAHRAVAAVAEDIEGLRFNRAVAQIYDLANALGKFQQALESGYSAAQLAALDDAVTRPVQLVAPMMPHLAETLLGRARQARPRQRRPLADRRPGLAG